MCVEHQPRSGARRCIHDGDRGIGHCRPWDGALDWYPASVDLRDREEVQDPAFVVAGFVIGDLGETFIAGVSDRDTLLKSGDAFFVTSCDELTFRAIGGDATVWRVAVVPEGGQNPFADGDGVGRVLAARTLAADQGEHSKISVKVVGLDGGDAGVVETNDAAVVFALGLRGKLSVSDERLAEGQALKKSAMREGFLAVSAEEEGRVAVIVARPVFGLHEDGQLRPRATVGAPAQDQPVPVPIRTPESSVDLNAPDEDGLNQADEALRGTNPTDGDSDDDGLGDGREVFTTGTNPTDPDGDRDDVTDGDEIAAGTNPNVPGNVAQGDAVGDGLSDADEVNILGTDPNNVDTDGDRLGDGAEINLFGTKPMVPDTDGDQLDDRFERMSDFTDPLNPDSYGNGSTDGAEITAGTSPNDPKSEP